MVFLRILNIVFCFTLGLCCISTLYIKAYSANPKFPIHPSPNSLSLGIH